MYCCHMMQQHMENDPTISEGSSILLQFSASMQKNIIPARPAWDDCKNGGELAVLELK